MNRRHFFERFAAIGAGAAVAPLAARSVTPTLIKQHSIELIPRSVCERTGLVLLRGDWSHIGNMNKALAVAGVPKGTHIVCLRESESLELRPR